MTAENVYKKAIDSGLNKADAAILVSGWIFENFGRSKRVFNYSQSFTAEDPDCVSEFGRSFSHVDWIDGESVVQAETTAGEDGFNLRFHQIEGDFDALRADMEKAFECLGTMRTVLHARFEELRNEINRINQDIHNCCHKGTVRPIDPGFSANIPAFDGLINSGTYLGNIKMNDTDAALWQTAKGYLLLPTVYSVGTDFIFDPRVQNAGQVARYFAEHPEIRDQFAEGVTKRALLEAFGDEILPGGRSLKTNLEILPQSGRYQSLDRMVSELASREASALRSRSGTGAAAAKAFGLDLAFENIAEAPVERLEFVPQSARVALSQAGIRSMGELGKSSAPELQRRLKQQGFEALQADLAEWTAVAATLSSIR